MKTLKERIADALASSGRNQVDLAKACEVKPPSVNDWLSGKSKSMKAATAHRAAAFLRVNFLWLTEGVGPKIPANSTHAGNGHRLEDSAINNYLPESSLKHKSKREKMISEVMENISGMSETGIEIAIYETRKIAKEYPLVAKKTAS